MVISQGISDVVATQAIRALRLPSHRLTDGRTRGSGAGSGVSGGSGGGAGVGGGVGEGGSDDVGTNDESGTNEACIRRKLGLGLGLGDGGSDDVGTHDESGNNEACIRRKLGLGDDDKVLLVVAGLRPVKDVLFLADTVTQMRRDDIERHVANGSSNGSTNGSLNGSSDGSISSWVLLIIGPVSFMKLGLGLGSSARSV